MDIQLRDRLTLAPLAILPSSPNSGFLTVELSERWWRPDTVTVEMDARVARDAGVVTGRLLVVDGLVFLVEQVHVASDGAGRSSSLATVTGYDPSSVPRLVLPSAGLSHDVQSSVPGETAMKHYVSASVGPEAAAPRRWGPLTIEPDAGRGTSGTWRGRFQRLDDWLELIGRDTEVGYQTVWNTGPEGPVGPVFTVGAGSYRDRLLAIREGTVYAEELMSSDVDRRTFVVVAGQGEGTGRTIETRFASADEPSELSRREAFVDARDTDSVATLRSRGDAKLAETASPDVVEVSVSERDGWRYRTDFGLGDQARYANDFGDDRLVRIVEVVSRWRESLVPDRTVSLDRGWPDGRTPDSGGARYV